MNIKIYVDTPLYICLMRRIKRDVLERGRDIKQILDQYNTQCPPHVFKIH
ncbi:MAG: hypothetical protein IRD7MM_04935 [Candidatus Midichloria mitochondrii]|nr:hypothetical protein [Candidatus Midichloria mitochondrii]